MLNFGACPGGEQARHDGLMPATGSAQQGRAALGITGVHIETQVGIGLGRVESQILKVVCFQFVDKPNAAPFLAQIDNYPTAFGCQM